MVNIRSYINMIKLSMQVKVLNNIRRSEDARLQGKLVMSVYLVHMQFKVNNSHFHITDYETIDFNFVTINLCSYMLKRTIIIANIAAAECVFFNNILYFFYKCHKMRVAKIQ